jgi:hypothetical protein
MNIINYDIILPINIYFVCNAAYRIDATVIMGIEIGNKTPIHIPDEAKNPVYISVLLVAV